MVEAVFDWLTATVLVILGTLFWVASATAGIIKRIGGHDGTGIGNVLG